MSDLVQACFFAMTTESAIFYQGEQQLLLTVPTGLQEKMRQLREGERVWIEHGVLEKTGKVGRSDLSDIRRFKNSLLEVVQYLSGGYGVFRTIVSHQRITLTASDQAVRRQLIQLKPTQSVTAWIAFSFEDNAIGEIQRLHVN